MTHILSSLIVFSLYFSNNERSLTTCFNWIHLAPRCWIVKEAFPLYVYNSLFYFSYFAYTIAGGLSWSRIGYCLSCGISHKRKLRSHRVVLKHTDIQYTIHSALHCLHLGFTLLWFFKRGVTVFSLLEACWWSRFHPQDSRARQHHTKLLAM